MTAYYILICHVFDKGTHRYLSIVTAIYNYAKLGGAKVSPTLITHMRKSLYQCMCVTIIIVIRRPCAHRAIAHVQAS